MTTFVEIDCCPVPSVRGYRPSDSTRFGDLTSQAVRAFQAHHHLQVDGIVGPVTWLNLKAAEQVCLQNHRKEV